MAEFNPNKLIAEIVETVKETHEAFIFETVHPYCEEVIQQKIDKQTLNEALLLYKNLKEHDAEVRAEVLDEILEECKKKSYSLIGYGYLVIDMKDVRKIVDKLKEKNDGCN